jgi:hypothetical protein
MAPSYTSRPATTAGTVRDLVGSGGRCQKSHQECWHEQKKAVSLHKLLSNTAVGAKRRADRADRQKTSRCDDVVQGVPFTSFSASIPGVESSIIRHSGAERTRLHASVKRYHITRQQALNCIMGA